MLKPYEIEGYQVSDGLYEEAVSIKKRGGKCFLVLQSDKLEGCAACHGTGYQYLQTVVGGPYESARGNGNGTACIYEDGAWFAVSTQSFNCPACMANNHGTVTL